MTIGQFLKSKDFKGLGINQQMLFNYLLNQLDDLDIVVIHRNEPVFVLKVWEMYQSNPRSQSNIATIRIKGNYTSIGPYEKNNENAKNCYGTNDIDNLIVHRIRRIYSEKLDKYRERR